MLHQDGMRASVKVFHTKLKKGFDLSGTANQILSLEHLYELNANLFHLRSQKRKLRQSRR